MSGKARNIPASVHRSLLNKARAEGVPFNELTQYYVLERFLYRMGRSPYGDRFILKGGLMFAVWQAPLSRPTRDVDLLETGYPSTEDIAAIIRSICETEVPDDGLRFDVEGLKVTSTREQDLYDGLRVRLTAYLGNARYPVQMDIGFGDVVVPEPVSIRFPTLLDFPAPQLLGYSRESAIAEKVHALVRWGTQTSRIRDFYDIWLLSQTADFDGLILSEAIQKTFTRRQTPIVGRLSALAPDPDASDRMQRQWQAFLRGSRIADAPGQLSAAMHQLDVFLTPVLAALAENRSFRLRWPAPGPWLI